MTARYKRVPQIDSGEEESKKIRAERIERITSKLHAIFWVLATVALVSLTDLVNLVHSDKINRVALNLAVVCFFANSGIFFYLTIWLPIVLKITAPWDVYCPNIIPLSTAIAVAFCFFSMIAFWPVWGVLTPIYIIVMLMGLIFSTHFIPWPC